MPPLHESRLLAAPGSSPLASAGLAACGEEEPSDSASRDRGHLRRRRRAEVPGADLAPAQPAARATPSYLSGLSPPSASSPPDTTGSRVFMRVENETDEPLQSAAEFEIDDTQGNGVRARSRSTTSSPTGPSCVAPGGSSSRHQQTVAGRRAARRARCCSSRSRSPSLDNRPLELLDPEPGRRDDGPSSTSTSRRAAAVSRGERRLQDLPRDGRGGVAARARADEQDADRDPRRRAAAPGRRRRTRRRCRSGRRPAPDSARPRGSPRRRSQRRVVSSSAVPVLPATRTPGIAAAVPVPSRTTPTMRSLTARATAGRRRPRRRLAAAGGRPRARASARSSVGAGRPPPRRSSPRRSPSAARVACTRPWPIARRADGEVVADLLAPAGSCVVAAPSMRRGRVEAEAPRPRPTSRSAPSSAPSGAKTELQDSRERLGQRAAARLAVGVLELDALQRRERLDGIALRAGVIPACERRRRA